MAAEPGRGNRGKVLEPRVPGGETWVVPEAFPGVSHGFRVFVQSE